MFEKSSSTEFMASNILRKALQNAIKIVKPSSLIKNRLQIDKNGNLYVHDFFNNKCEPTSSILTNLFQKDIFLIGFGKAAGDMGDEFLDKISKFNQENKSKTIEINKGIFSIPFGCEMKRIDSFKDVKFYHGAKNNLPDNDSVETTSRILHMIDQIPIKSKTGTEEQSESLVLCFISGGGSALLSAPVDNVTLEGKLKVIKTMVNSGATITELNSVRSTLSKVKQGKLAQKIHSRKADVVSLILSDIVSDPLSQIASGPTCVPEISSTTIENILRKLNLKDKIPARIQSEMFKNIPKYDENSDNLMQNLIIGNNKLSHFEAQKAFQEQEFEILDMGFENQGTVPEFVDCLLKKIDLVQNSQLSKGCLIIASGETTLKIHGNSIGLGGRCQHMGLLMLSKFLEQNMVKPGYKIEILFSGTDGIDGPTPISGVNFTLPHSQEKKTKIFDKKIVEKHCETFDSYGFFKEYFPEALIEIGPTGTNVMDIYMILITKTE